MQQPLNPLWVPAGISTNSLVICAARCATNLDPKACGLHAICICWKLRLSGLPWQRADHNWGILSRINVEDETRERRADESERAKLEDEQRNQKKDSEALHRKRSNSRMPCHLNLGCLSLIFSYGGSIIPSSSISGRLFNLICYPDTVNPCQLMRNKWKVD